ncbi:neural cell adhesion molecule 2 isoform X2 [Zeugodacus cucurbitae]|uniref:Nephrin n=1 Tax=Zeugodacus cucurbitae TaxID=28588 RepID=A0A0A1X8H1_ZEUCU|nr:neural cell adhesion molecule 2 isoform X2 [Zeugodacus cucurbitae]
MKNLLLLFIYLIKLLVATQGNKDVPFYQIEALIGETIHLPCNATAKSGDEAVLILWYREDKGTPIYSVDIRSGITKTARRWSDESIFGNRAYFLFEGNPWELTIRNSQISDTGVYRCRVDFMKAQTYNSKIVLIIIALPKEIIIRDEQGFQRSTVAGPYNVGDYVILKCEAIGGNPTPELAWFFEDINLEYEMATDIQNKSIQSVIKFGPLRREHLNGRLTCQARNHLKAALVQAIVQIDMNFPPLSIRLLGAHQPLSAGRRYDLLCQSAGGRPPAVITWWQNEIRLEKTTETISSDGNQTTSTLSIIFEKSDSGKYLSCKAYNLAKPVMPLVDGWILDIQYIPEVQIRLGTSLKQNTIREGADVYFDCVINAHPPVYRVDWRHNGHILPSNISQGVIISNHSLVLQGVNKASGGNFSCIGYNTEGEGQSPSFSLDILYAPICLSNQLKVYGIAKHENVNVTCSVDANPPIVDFNWIFNNSIESIDVATNHISKTGRPDQVHNCSFINITVSSVIISCVEGFNGGLPQLFIMEVRNMYSKELYVNKTSSQPRFTLTTLIPGNPYILSIYASNLKGRSDATILNIDVIKTVDTRLNAGQVLNHRAEFVFSPFLSLSVGLSIAICIAILAIIFSLRTTCKNSSQIIKEFSHEHNLWEVSSRSSGSKEMDLNESDERNPDVIPELLEIEKQEYTERMMQQVATIGSNITNQFSKQPEVISHLSLTLRRDLPIRAYLNPSQNAYLSSNVNQSSLPKHIKNQMFSGYNSLVIGMNTKQSHVSMQQFLSRSAKSMSLAPESTSKIFSAVNSNQLEQSIPDIGKRYECNSYEQANRRYKHNNLRAKDHINASISDDEISAQTPLMTKRESTV